MSTSEASVPLIKPSSSVTPSDASAADKRVSLLNIIAFLINFTVVGLSNYGVWGKTNADVSEEYLTLVTPTGPAFSIWGFIYMTETAFVVWQALPKNIGNKVVTQGVGKWFIAASILQAIWSIAFAQEQIVLSAILLVAIAGSLVQASISLFKFRTPDASWSEYLLTSLPIGIHAGWVWAAAVVNVNAALVSRNASVETQVSSAILSILLSAVGAGIASIQYKDDFFLASVVWALLGIWVRSDYRKEILGKDVAAGLGDAIKYTAISLIALVSYSILLTRKRTRTA